MTVLRYYGQSFPTVFAGLYHFLNCLLRVSFILTEEADADAVKLHTGHTSSESAALACWVKWQD